MTIKKVLLTSLLLTTLTQGFAKDIPLTINGLVEVEVSQTENYQGVNSGDIIDPTVEIYAGTTIDMWSGNINFAYGEGVNFDVDEAFITYDKEGTISFAAGKKIIPFGTYASNLITDTITNTMFETHESILQLLWKNYNFNASVYALNGDKDVSTDDNNIKTFGGELNYTWEDGGNSLNVGINYINNISETDTIQPIITNYTKRVGGYGANLSLVFGNINFNGEYISADKKFRKTDLTFKNKGATPAAYHAELGYNFEIMSKKTNISIGHATTMEAQAFSMPKKRWLAGGNIKVAKGTTLFLEYIKDEDYEVSAGGTAKEATTYTGKVAFAF